MKQIVFGASVNSGDRTTIFGQTVRQTSRLQASRRDYERSSLQQKQAMTREVTSDCISSSMVSLQNKT
jgi:hypothetical protein